MKSRKLSKDDYDTIIEMKSKGNKGVIYLFFYLMWNIEVKIKSFITRVKNGGKK